MTPDAAGPPAQHGTHWLHILRRRDVLSGLMFMGLAVFALVISRDYPMGTALRMGTGYVPRLLSWILFALGLVVLLQDVIARGEEAPAEEDSLPVWKPLIFITASIVVFGLTIERWGLVISILLLVAIGSLAGAGKRWVETLIAGVVMAAASVVIFVWGLGLVIPIWPGD